MNNTKIILQRIAGTLLTTVGAFGLVGLTLVHNYGSDFEHLMRDMAIFNILSIIMGLALMFIGMMLFADSLKNVKTGKISEKTGTTIAAIAASGASMILQIIDLTRIFGERGGSYTRANLVPPVVVSMILLLAVIVLAILALTMKHGKAADDKEKEKESNEKERQQDLQIRYLQMRVVEMRESIESLRASHDTEQGGENNE
jgi:drug/metabolite transporter (DMT)-like permease